MGKGNDSGQGYSRFDQREQLFEGMAAPALDRAGAHCSRGASHPRTDRHLRTERAGAGTIEGIRCRPKHGSAEDSSRRSEHFPVGGDAPALQRAVQNLIVNAAKHGGKGRWIGVTGVIDEDVEPAVVEVQIADRGKGIPPEELKEIFEPFYRGSAAEADQVRGSGLGLTLVKEIIEAHEGSVMVETRVGQGTTFIVRLPAADGKNGP